MSSALASNTAPSMGFGKRHIVFWAAILVNFIVWVDDAVFGTLTPYWAGALHLTSAQIGSISASYLLGYFPILFIAGFLADLIGPKILLTICLVGCSALSTSMLFMHTASELWWRNFIFGIFFGFLWAPSNRVLAIWFPQKERIRYTSLWFSSTMAAFALAGPIGLSIAAHSTWQNAFLFVTILAIPILIFFLVAVKDRPEDKRGISEQELQYIYMDRGDEAVRSGFQWSHLRQAFKQPSTYFMCIAAGLATTPNWLTTTWGSTGLINGFKISPDTAGIIITLMYVIPLLVGFITNWFVRRVFRGRTRPSLALGPFLAGLAFLLASVWSPNAVIYAILVYGIAACSNPFFWGTVNAYWAGLVSPEVTGTLNGIGAGVQVLFGYLIVNWSGNWVNHSVQGIQSLTRVWVYGGIAFLVTVIFVYLSREIRIQASAPSSRLEGSGEVNLTS
ncbi:MAG: MFS transporter [Alicyclobacillus sp.]|nr:MFS transporter [Alicyclobacillus sp.]